MKNKWGVDRFDLEEAMMHVAMTQDDIMLVSEMAYEKDWSADKTMNAWIGVSHLLEARTLKQEEIYSKLFELDEYSPQKKGYNFDEDRMDIIGRNGNNGEHYDSQLITD